jgi:predicted phosphodiesterase
MSYWTLYWHFCAESERAVRIAVVSDVHSNLAALEAVLQHAEEHKALDAVWSLGDFVGYGPQPNEVIALLSSHSLLAVSGNHDLAATGAIDTNDFNPDAAAANALNAADLTPESRHFLRDLPEITSASDLSCIICHGSLRSPSWEYLITEEAARTQFELMETPWSFVGHTHIPLIIEMEAGGTLQARRPQSGESLELSGRRLILNPGGVGQPRDGDPRAAYAIVDTQEQTVEFWRVAYPIEQTQALMAATDMPVRLIDRLARGR